MNPLARSAIVRLKTEFGVTLDPIEDLHHILTIADLADRVLRVQVDHESEAVLHPELNVGNLTFRRLSIGAKQFLHDRVLEWFDPESFLCQMSFAYCYAHAKTPSEMWGYSEDKRGWKRAVQKWVKTVDASEREIVSAVDAFQEHVSEIDALVDKLNAGDRADADADDIPEPRKGSGSLGPMFGVLCSEYGTPTSPETTSPEYWAWKVPEEEVSLLLRAYYDRRDEEIRSRRRGKGHAVASDPDDTMIRADRALKKYIRQIADERKEAQAAGIQDAGAANYLNDEGGA